MDKLSEAKTTRGRVSLRTVLCTRILCGFYCTVSTRAAVRVITRLYCIFIAYFINSLLLTTIRNMPMLMMFFGPKIIEFNISILISFLTEEKHFINVCKIIEQVDRQMGYDELTLITPAAVYMFMFICLSKFTFLFIFLFTTLNMRIDRIFVCTSLIKIALGLNPMTSIILLDLLRQRLILLRRSVKSIINDQNLSTNYISNQIKGVNDSLNIYKTLIDGFNPNTEFLWKKLQIFASLIAAFVVFLTHGYNIVFHLTAQRGSFDMNLMTIAEILSDTLVACSPAIFTELVILEVDKLKAIIANGIIDKDNELCSELVLAGQYLELRPFKISILRVLNLDGLLVTTFAGLCTTYLIFLIQVTGVI